MPAALTTSRGLPPKKKSVEAAPVVVDQRQALTDAIHAEFAAKHLLAAKQDAISRCRTSIDEAGRRLERAQTAISKAKETDAIKAAAALSAGRDVSGAPHTERAEAAVTEPQHGPGLNKTWPG